MSKEIRNKKIEELLNKNWPRWRLNDVPLPPKIQEWKNELIKAEKIEELNKKQGKAGGKKRKTRKQKKSKRNSHKVRKSHKARKSHKVRKSQTRRKSRKARKSHKRRR